MEFVPDSTGGLVEIRGIVGIAQVIEHHQVNEVPFTFGQYGPFFQNDAQVQKNAGGQGKVCNIRIIQPCEGAG